MAERSELAGQDLLAFVVHGDLQTRVQKALNNEQYEAAQALRARQDEVATVMQQRSDARRQRGGEASPAEAEAELANAQARVLVLRSSLNAAVAEERYAEAASLRDQLAAAEGSAAAAAAALQAAKAAVFRFALGQRVVHAVHRWAGVVAGVDRCFADSQAFARACAVDDLPRGRQQPFYVVLPDAGDVGDSECVMYVAEDRLRPLPPLAAGDACPEPVAHSFAYHLYLGPDAQGGYIPTRELRERYGAPRVDVWPPGEEPDDG